MLAHAVESEVADFMARHADERLEDGRARVVRHGKLQERTIQTGIGGVATENESQCMLVIIGVTPEGKKELVGFVSG